jgi:hypothetical protein
MAPKTEVFKCAELNCLKKKEVGKDQSGQGRLQGGGDI